MAWFDEAIFYHIYPLGLTGAPTQNSYCEPTNHFPMLSAWTDHLVELNCNALYIGPLFQSVGHGYETTDYYTVDSRLGTNEEFTQFVTACHQKGIHVIIDAVFNHVGRDFFAFKDLQTNREDSAYKDWFCNVNFWNNNEYDDGFSYDNWGGYNLLVKLNLHNPEVRDYLLDVLRFWITEFDIDGLRLDAADVLDFDFMKTLRHVSATLKDDFWLMGEVIHGEYNRWVNPDMLHAVTNYALHKALYSGHNDHNYFEIAHTVKRIGDMAGGNYTSMKLYNFVDNHDVDRIPNKLSNRAHIIPVYILLYTLPGIPAIYYGSEFGIEGHKEAGSDAPLRPSLDLNDFEDDKNKNPITDLIVQLGALRQKLPALAYGDYRELLLTNRQFAFARTFDGSEALTTVNNDDSLSELSIPTTHDGIYHGLLTNQTAHASDGRLSITLAPNSGEIWVHE